MLDLATISSVIDALSQVASQLPGGPYVTLVAAVLAGASVALHKYLQSRKPKTTAEVIQLPVKEVK